MSSNPEMNTPKHPPLDEVLQSIDHLQPVEVNPFLYTRIMARLQKPDAREVVRKSWVWATGLTLLFLITANIMSWTFSGRGAHTSGTGSILHEYFQEQLTVPY